MQRPIGFVLILVGIALLGWTFTASESVTSEISKFVTGEPSDKAIKLGISSLVALCLGAVLVTRGGSRASASF